MCNEDESGRSEDVEVSAKEKVDGAYIEIDEAEEYSGICTEE